MGIMLPNDVPACLHCESRDFRPGATISNLTTQFFTCNKCDALVQLLWQDGQGIFVYFREDQLGPPQYEANPQDFVDWINDILLWRDRQAKIREFDDTEWRTWLKDEFFQEFPEYDGMWSEGTIAYRDLSPEAQAFRNRVFGDPDKEAKKRGNYLPLPPELKPSVYPPKVLPQYKMMYHTSQGWSRVDPDLSAQCTVPEDPILVNNRNFFRDVINEILGQTKIPNLVVEAENQYRGKEPWFTFQVGECKFTMGWRKRVVSIQVEAAEGIGTEKIRALAKDRDGVTYEAQGPLVLETAEDFGEKLRKAEPECVELIKDLVETRRRDHPDGKMVRDGGWQDERPVAYLLEVHAWGKEKTIEYLVALIEAARSSQVAA